MSGHTAHPQNQQKSLVQLFSKSCEKAWEEGWQRPSQK
jgi:hypothetical protein